MLIHNGAIKSFVCKRTAAVFQGLAPKGFPTDILAVARRKLRILDAAIRLDELRVPTSNRLEALKGGRADNIAFGSTTSGASVSFRSKAARTMSRSSTTTKEASIMGKKITREALDAGRIDLSDVATGKTLPPVSLGEILREEFLRPRNLSARALARDRRGFEPAPIAKHLYSL